MVYHIKVGARSWCEWTGSVAGQKTATETGVSCCEYRTRALARVAAKKLQPHFTVPVRAEIGPCEAMKPTPEHAKRCAVPA